MEGEQSEMIEAVDVPAAEDKAVTSSRSPILNVWFRPRETMAALMARKKSGIWKDPYQLRLLLACLCIPSAAVFLGIAGGGGFLRAFFLPLEDWMGAAFAIVPSMLVYLYLFLYIQIVSFFTSFVGSKGVGKESFRAARAAILWGYVPILGAVGFDLAIKLLPIVYPNAAALSFGRPFSATSQILLPVLAQPAFLFSAMSAGVGSTIDFTPIVVLVFGTWSLVTTSKLLGELYSSSAWYGFLVLMIGWFGVGVAWAVLGLVVRVALVISMQFLSH